MKLYIYLLLLSIITTKAANSQAYYMTLKVNNNILQPNDTLVIDVEYVNEYNEPAQGSLIVQLLNSKGNTWNYRYPIIKGFGTAKVILGTTLPKDIYYAYFATTNVGLQVQAKLLNNIGLTTIDASITNKKSIIYTPSLVLNDKDSFVYDVPFFENKGLLTFINPVNKATTPEVAINCLLDSTLPYTATKYLPLYVGVLPTDSSYTITSMPTQIEAVQNYVQKKIYSQKMVVVKGKAAKKPAQQFEDKYVTGLFVQNNGRKFNLIDDKSIKNGITVLQYLEGNIPNFRVDDDVELGRNAMVRNVPVSFFYDEVEVDLTFIEALLMDDIGLIKQYSPPFMGGLAPSNFAIALYYKNEYSNSRGNCKFKINGYTPLIHTWELAGE